MKRKLEIIFLGLIFALSPFSFLVPNADAQGFNPTFSGSISTLTLGANPNITLSVSLPAGDAFPDYGTFTIPAGFDINAGTNLPDGAIVGTVSTSFVRFGTTYNLDFSVKNLTNTLGHKTRWEFAFPAPFCCLRSNIDGSLETGHTFTINPVLSDLETPLTFTFNIFGLVSGTPVITNPTVAGEYKIRVDLVAPGIPAVIKNVLVNFPALTPSGTNVTNTFNDGVTITYNRVVGAGGKTTITSSTTPPAEGTGQFQIGGVYYDFNTTANIRCPCTVTLPYDPAVTSDPRIYHLEGGVWVDATTSVNTFNSTVTGVVSSFSFFAVGQPLYNVSWQNPIPKLIENHGNPFPLEDDEDLGIKFNLLDSDEAIAIPENVTVEIWQTADSNGVILDTLVKALTLTPELNENKSRFQTELDLDDTPLALGTYEIRVLVSNTTATQTPSIASFTVVEDD